jgi:hypothetical protein
MGLGLLALYASGRKTNPKAGIVSCEKNIKHKKNDAVLINCHMNKLALFTSLCIFSSASWSNCIGDCVNGYGTKSYSGKSAGQKYAGQFKNGKKNGQGTYTWPDGAKYVGRWKDGDFNGQGTHTWPNGDKYVGRWKDDKRNGQGTQTWSGGNKYVGQWKDDKKNGQGTYSWSDGRQYVGQWKDDAVIPGQGIEYLIDGTQIVYGSTTELIGANGQTLRTNVLSNELAGIRSESVENKGRADELLAKQKEKDRQLAIKQRQDKKLIVGIQRQLIEYQYLSGIADGIAGRNTSKALERFYQDAEIIRPSLTDYTTITEDLDLSLMNAEGSCSNNSVGKSTYAVCFDFGL